MTLAALLEGDAGRKVSSGASRGATRAHTAADTLHVNIECDDGIVVEANQPCPAFGVAPQRAYLSTVEPQGRCDLRLVTLPLKSHFVCEWLG